VPGVNGGGTLLQVSMGGAERLVDGTLDSLQVTTFADFCIILGKLLDTSFEHDLQNER